MLLDSGPSHSIIDSQCLPSSVTIIPDPNGIRTFTTKAGTFKTTHIAKMKINFPDLNPQQYYKVTMHIDNSGRYKSFKAILGRDMLRYIGIAFNFTSTPPNIQLENFTLPMTTREKNNQIYMKQSSPTLNEQMKNESDNKLAILPVEYNKASLQTLNPSHLSLIQQYDNIHETIETLPELSTSSTKQKDSTPYHGQAITIQDTNQELLKHDNKIIELYLSHSFENHPWPTFSLMQHDITYKNPKQAHQQQTNIQNQHKITNSIIKFLFIKILLQAN
jgi:hypothetical protein